VFVPVEALIWIRSLARVLLIVVHALRHVEMKKVAGEATPSLLKVPHEMLAGLRLQLQVTVTVVVRVVLVAHFPGRLLVPAPAAALLAGVFGRVELAARSLADQAGRVGMAGQAALVGTVARADQVGRAVQAGRVGTAVGIAVSRAETPSGACSP
jgi:hypothetical protein